VASGWLKLQPYFYLSFSITLEVFNVNCLCRSADLGLGLELKCFSEATITRLANWPELRNGARHIYDDHVNNLVVVDARALYTLADCKHVKSCTVENYCSSLRLWNRQRTVNNIAYNGLSGNSATGIRAIATRC